MVRLQATCEVNESAGEGRLSYGDIMVNGWHTANEAISILCTKGFVAENNKFFAEAWKGAIPKAGSLEDDAIYYLRAWWGYDSYIEGTTYYVVRNPK